MVKYDIWKEGYYEDGKFINLNAWTGTLTSNTITIEVAENKAPKNKKWPLHRLERWQAKEEIIQILGKPDWQGSGINTIMYYDMDKGEILEINFDADSKLIDYRIKKSNVFPESPRA